MYTRSSEARRESFCPLDKDLSWKSADVTDYVSNMSAMFIGLGEDAILAVWRAVQEAPDARLAYEILKDIGVVPNRCERNLAEIQQSVR